MPLNYAPIIKYGPKVVGITRKLIGAFKEKVREEDIHKLEVILESIEMGINDTEKRLLVLERDMRFYRAIALISIGCSVIIFIALIVILSKLS